MNCLIQKMGESLLFSLRGIRDNYYRYPAYTSTYDPDNCMMGLLLEVIFYVLLGALIGIIIGRLINAVFGRIEGKPVVYRYEPRQNADNYETKVSELPDEYLQRRKKFSSDEYHNP